MKTVLKWLTVTVFFVSAGFFAGVMGSFISFSEMIIKASACYGNACHYVYDKRDVFRLNK